jgi:prepilin-type processing-associated H-X9-DG protein
LDININEVDLSNDFDQLEASLQNIDYVIKNGKVVKHEDKIDINENGHIFWADGHVDAQVRERIIPKKKEFYQKYYSMFYDRLECHLKPNKLRKID